ncbi:MAG: diguanylate cyclase [Bryobacteraceae bacterium]
MISLKDYLFATRVNGDADNVYRRVIGLLLRGISLHAVEGDKSEYEKFRGDIEALELSVTPEMPVTDLLVAAGTVLRALEEYNQRTRLYMRRQSVEMQKMVTMLAETLITISAARDLSVGKLQDIEKQLERVSAIEDIQLLKARLADCLCEVRDEALRQTSEASRTLQKLRTEVAGSLNLARTSGVAAEPDKATGLPNYADAQNAIRLAMVSPVRSYLVTAVVARVQAVNARFGYAIGDRLLNEFYKHFQSGFSPADRLYRWRGPVLVALIERDEPIDQVRAELQRYTGAKHEATLEIGSRSVLMPISAGWSVFPVAPPFESLIQKIESFLATQLSCDHSEA